GIGNMLGAKSIKRTFVDREGNLWIGTNGNGLVKLVDDYFAFYQFAEDNQNNVQSVFVDEDLIWMGHSGGLTVTTRNPEELVSEYGVEEGLADTIFASVTKDAHGTVWAASKGMGLYYKLANSEKFDKFALPDDKLSNKVNHLLVSGSILWAATDFGIYQIKDFEIKSHITMRAGLPHNVVKAMFKDLEGRVWIATHSSEITYIDEFIQTAQPPLKENLVDATCFAQDRNGEVWVGTNGTGVFKITGSDTTIFRKNDGLHSDYCYSIICDAQNRLWVGHRGGMSRIDVDNSKVEAFYPSSSSKLDFSANAVCRDAEGLLWFGTNSGLLRYNLEKDVPNVIEPALNLTHVNVSDSLHGIIDHIELPYGSYKIRFDFVGISFKKPENVAYKYILEGHDLGWSELKEQNFASYNRLDPGDYLFNVTSFNADGYGGRDIRSIKVSVDYPFWEKWWFYVGVAISVFMLIRMVVRRRERIMRENQEYLQHELNQRTREVVEQKELLEIKNKDITDSIIYAKNIQKAMLPAPDSLEHIFTDSFVFFKPRDIVSGDFYWVQNYENKIIVACADCTGHGVPGAFMSLIGNVLLKEVARNEMVNSPDQVLGMLDQELGSLLNKKGSEFGVQDGMDISVVEFDTDTYMMRGASAKRPIVIYKSGERVEIKGDRFAVGGNQESNSKVFTLHEIQLAKGDVVYQFSDGYADQFGGELGKKLKMKRMMTMLDELVDLDMAQQSRIVKQKFHEWKGHLPQVDDVILVGIKL
ncbi:MAG: serine phosphatase RsbU (regulator of sigma subunit)/streptogramin lyase, partial [Flavobacteriales bacterium]